MRDLNLLNQAWPNAVFGLRPRLFFLLIPYIHIFVLHRRFYERKRPYHLRASDLRGNGTDPGDDPVHPHALRCQVPDILEVDARLTQAVEKVFDGLSPSSGRIP